MKRYLSLDVEDTQKANPIFVSLHNLLSNRHIRILLFLIIFTGILARFYKPSGPPIDHHSFRQCDTAAIARNFYEGSMDIFYPQIDWRGSSSGYVESEFQVYTFLVSALYHIFGPYEIVARSLNIFFYVLSSFLLFKFASRLFNQITALFAVFFYSFIPLTLYFNRSIQPDTLMCLASLAGIYYFWIWADEKHVKFLILSAICIMVAILIKPLNLYLGLPLLYLSYQRFKIKLVFTCVNSFAHLKWKCLETKRLTSKFK